MYDLKLKICGLMQEQDVETCILNKVDIVGFVVEYPVDVPWNMSRDRAKPLIDAFHYYNEKCGGKSKCCVVTGGKNLTGIAEFLKPDYIQMHYKETADDIKLFKQSFIGTDVKCIKTVKTVDDALASEVAGVDILLVDARGPENASNSKAALDIKLYEDIKEKVKIPVMAAGGITPENARYIIESVKPDLIDVMTGVETQPGVKSIIKIKDLVEIVNQMREV